MPDQKSLTKDPDPERSPFSSSLRTALEVSIVAFIVRVLVSILLRSFDIDDYFPTTVSILDAIFVLLISMLAGFRADQKGVDRRRYVYLAGAASIFILLELLVLYEMSGFRIGSSSFRREYTLDSGRLIMELLYFCVFAIPAALVAGLIAIPAPRIINWFLEEQHPQDEQLLADQKAELSGEPGVGINLPPIDVIPSSLHNAYQLLRSGQPNQAVRLLAKHIKSNPRSEYAWLLIAYALDDNERKRESLQRVLKLNPGNSYATEMVSRLNHAEQVASLTGEITSKAKPVEVESKLDLEPKRLPTSKLHLLFTTIGLVIYTVFPFLMALLLPFRFRQVNQDIYIRNTALLLSIPIGLILILEGVNQIRSYLRFGAINGLMVGFVDNLVLSIGYYMVHVPSNRGDTVAQAILRRIAGGAIGSTLWGTAVGTFGTLLPFLFLLAYDHLKKWVYNVAPQNAWASVLAAMMTTEPDKKSRFVSGALTLQPGNPIANRMQTDLHSAEPTTVAPAASSKPHAVPLHQKLPPLISTRFGAKFVRRVVILVVIFTIWTIVEVVRGEPGEGFSTFSYFLCCLSLLLGGGFLLWILVEGFRKLAGRPEEDQTSEPSDPIVDSNDDSHIDG
jgi:hypothetical protein